MAQAVTTIDEGKALASLNEDIAKSILKMQEHTAQTLNMASAIRTGGQAVITAQAAIAAQPLIDQIESLQVSMAKAEQTNGKTSSSYLGLAASLANAKAQLQAVQQAFAADKSASYVQDLASGFDSLRGKIQALQIEGAAIGQSTEQLREAAVQAQLAQFVAAHPGLDTGTAEWAAYADEVERASKAQQQNADKAGAQRFDLAGSLKNSIDELERYRKQLEAAHASTIAIDAAEQDKNRATIESYGQLLLKTGNLKDGLQAFYNQTVLDSKTSAQQIFDVFTTAYQGINDALTKFVTGQKGAFAELGKSIEQSLAKSAVQTLTQKAVAGIGSIFHVNLGASGKPDGTKSNPLWVQEINAAKNIADTLGGKTGDSDSGSAASDSPSGPFGKLTGALKNIGSKLGDAFKNIFSSIGSVFGKIGGGLSGFFGSIGGLFGGFKADGGDVQPGKAYVVGERRPELFIPHAAGRIAPSVSAASFSASNQQSVNVSAHFHGVQDADTFKMSQNHILNLLANHVSRAVSRR